MPTRRAAAADTLTWGELSNEHQGRTISLHPWWNPDSTLELTFSHTDGEAGIPNPGAWDDDTSSWTQIPTLIHHVTWPDDGGTGPMQLPADAEVTLR